MFFGKFYLTLIWPDFFPRSFHTTNMDSAQNRFVPLMFLLHVPKIVSLLVLYWWIEGICLFRIYMAPPYERNTKKAIKEKPTTFYTAFIFVVSFVSSNPTDFNRLTSDSCSYVTHLSPSLTSFLSSCISRCDHVICFNQYKVKSSSNTPTFYPPCTQIVRFFVPNFK